jgi:hypothetical protein
MGVLSTQGIEFQLVADGQILDLFKDEDVFLSDNVTGLFDLGVIPADFTRQITLPGSKKNNAFFEHVYDISIQNPDIFATNIKVPAYLDFGGIYLSQGYLQLNKVNILGNKFIDSYEVTIYGAVSSFARQINRGFLNDLTSLSQYNHTSSFTNISSSWSGDLFDGSIVYPLADYGQGWIYSQGSTAIGIDDAVNGGAGQLSVMDFKPSIKVKNVWDAIFTEAGYSYSSSFINDGGFNDIYLLCNRQLRYPVYAGVDLETLGVAKISPVSASGQTDLKITEGTNTNLPWYNVQKDPSNVIGTNSSYTITLDHSSSLECTINLQISLSGSIGGPNLSFIVRDTGSLSLVSSTNLTQISSYFQDNTFNQFAEGTLAQDRTWELSEKFSTSQLGPGTYYFGLNWTDTFAAPYNNFTFILDKGGKPKSYLEINKIRQAADGRVIDIPLNMPYGTRGIKQIDFITSIQKKFNLVIYPSKSVRNQFIVESFNKWYNTGRRWDFNKYANLNDKIEVIPANNLAVNELNFADTLDQDYISQQFAKGANREYGKAYYVDQENFFSQGKFEVKTSLASTPLLYLQGTGLSGSVEGIAPTPPVSSFTFIIGPNGYSNANDACSNTYYFPTTVYAEYGNVDTVTKLYSDSNLTIPFNGQYSYWKWGYPYYYSKSVSFIDYDGNVYSTTECL